MPVQVAMAALRYKPVKGITQHISNYTSSRAPGCATVSRSKPVTNAHW